MLLRPNLKSLNPWRSMSSVATLPTSNVFRGTKFEERSLNVLQKLSMSLKRVGGKADGGVDLVGWWWLPASGRLPEDNVLPRRRIRVLAQCKAFNKKLGPSCIREMEGVMHRFMLTPSSVPSVQEPEITPSLVQTPLVALFVSQSPFTKSALLRALSSPVPFFLLHLPPLDEVTGTAIDQQLGSMVCNPALTGAQGLLKGEMEVRWERSLSGGGNPGLWWQGSRLVSMVPETTGTSLENVSPTNLSSYD
ncbi:hypothetical protein BDQ17DRAFT_1355800 [Cyathus striatus]|nr:hypothetical protein BDQ17DRAFT_1355800 [Cyathus striatus]